MADSKAPQLAEQEQPRKPGFKDPIGDRMKAYEQETQHYIEKSKPWIVRLDGHHFSKFSRGFKKPFDPRLANAMIRTTADLLAEFGPSMAYTQSDEITLVFPALEPEHPAEQIFGGKVSKIVSLMASFCGVRFSYHILREEFNAESESKLKEKIASCMAYFDARAFNLPTQVEAVNNVIWRSHVDCRRNSILNLGCAHFSTKEMHGWSTNEVYQNLLKKGVDWNTYPAPYKFGTFFKKEKFDKEATDPKTQQPLVVVRTKVSERSFDLRGFSKTHATLLFAKYWNDYDEEVAKTTPEDPKDQPKDHPDED